MKKNVQHTMDVYSLKLLDKLSPVSSQKVFFKRESNGDINIPIYPYNNSLTLIDGLDNFILLPEEVSHVMIFDNLNIHVKKIFNGGNILTKQTAKRLIESTLLLGSEKKVLFDSFNTYRGDHLIVQTDLTFHEFDEKTVVYNSEGVHTFQSIKGLCNA